MYHYFTGIDFSNTIFSGATKPIPLKLDSPIRWFQISVISPYIQKYKHPFSRILPKHIFSGYESTG